MQKSEGEVYGIRRTAAADRFAAARRELRVLLGLFAAALSLPLFMLLSIRFQRGEGTYFEYLLVCLIAVILVLGVLAMYVLGVKHLQLSEERNNFVSAISHELKTPVTSIRMYAEMLNAGVATDAERVRAYNAQIMSESVRLSKLVENVLQLSSLEKVFAESELRPQQLSELMRSVMEALAPMVKDTGFKLTLMVDQKSEEEGITLLCNVDSVTRMFINLIENAIKFSQDCETKEIQLGYRIERGRKGSVLILFVRDFGPGVNRSDEKKIFGLFYRGGDENTRKTGGTGIGLALVRALANQMGAKVRVINAQPGAEFQIAIGELV